MKKNRSTAQLMAAVMLYYFGLLFNRLHHFKIDMDAPWQDLPNAQQDLHYEWLW
jgi:hypothetical protein